MKTATVATVTTVPIVFARARAESSAQLTRWHTQARAPACAHAWTCNGDRRNGCGGELIPMVPSGPIVLRDRCGNHHESHESLF